MILHGLHPVVEAIRAGHARRVMVSARDERRVREALDAARRAGLAVERVPVEELDRLTQHGVHQGIAAEIVAPGRYSVAELVQAARSEPALIVVLDGVEDPHNVGAILRSADAAGAHGVVRQTRHAARLDGIAAKASAGAVAYVRIADVVNIARAIDELKDLGVWTVGLDAEATESHDAVDFTVPTAIVVGAEGSGLRRLVREHCNRLAAIPLHGHVESLNVSVATGIVLFEALRQRMAPDLPAASWSLTLDHWLPGGERPRQKGCRSVRRAAGASACEDSGACATLSSFVWLA